MFVRRQAGGSCFPCTWRSRLVTPNLPGRGSGKERQVERNRTWAYKESWLLWIVDYLYSRMGLDTRLGLCRDVKIPPCSGVGLLGFGVSLTFFGPRISHISLFFTAHEKEKPRFHHHRAPSQL